MQEYDPSGIVPHEWDGGDHPSFGDLASRQVTQDQAASQGCPWKSAEHGCGTGDCAQFGQHPNLCSRPDAEPKPSVKQCPWMAMGALAHHGQRDLMGMGFHICATSECRLWETKTEDAGVDPEDKCPRAAAGQCSEGCHRFYKIRTMGRCSQGGDWEATGITRREGSPFCGSWREASVVDD